MKILFVGELIGNSGYHYKILKKKKKNIHVINPSFLFRKIYILRLLFIHISPKIFEKIIDLYFVYKVKNLYDIIYVTSGEYIGKKTIINLKKNTHKIILYCPDNPFVKRDKKRWVLFKQSAKYYDRIVYIQPSRIKLAKKHGLANHYLINPHYERSIHKKHKITKYFKKRFNSDVIFIGTWFPDRGRFIKRIIEANIDIKIYGSRWDKDPFYKILKSKINLGHFDGPIYSKLIQSSKIAICLTSTENLDSITSRSIEIPAIGTFMLAIKTKAHEKILISNKEAVYFKSANECIKKCQYYLSNSYKREQIARNGHKKIVNRLKLNNENFFNKIFNFN